MKLTVSILVMVIFCFPVFGQTGSPYDAELANKLGADDYGMKTYIMAFLLTGDRVSEYSQEERIEIQKGHMANILLLAEMGKLILAGPFSNGGEKRGIFLFDVATKAEAEELTNTDPAVQAGVLKMELLEWYGSAALMMVPEVHEKVQKKAF
jgi:uncharacterized protein